MLVDVCLPIKNEELILKENVFKLFCFLKSQQLNYNWQIILIVNGSTDDSFKIAKSLETEHEKYFKIKLLKDSGKGLAIKEWSKNSNADIIAFMDIDLAVDFKYLPNLINPILQKRADLVIGSRFLPQSLVTRSFLRSFISQKYNSLSRLIFHNKFTDLQCGFKAFTKETFKKLSPFLRDNKYFFDSELIILSQYFGLTVLEIPADWKDCRFFKRKSKVKIRDVYFIIRSLIGLKRYLKKINKDGNGSIVTNQKINQADNFDHQSKL